MFHVGLDFLFCFTSGFSLWFFLRSFLLEFGFLSFILGFCASFFVSAVATGKTSFLVRAFNFVCSALLGLRNYLFGFRGFFVSVSAAAGTIFWWACGNFVSMFGLCLFDKKVLGSCLKLSNFASEGQGSFYCWRWTFEATCFFIRFSQLTWALW